MDKIQQDTLNGLHKRLLSCSKKVIKAEIDYKASRYLSDNFRKAKNNTLNDLHKIVAEIDNYIASINKKLF